jgi:hypothetical protein
LVVVVVVVVVVVMVAVYRRLVVALEVTPSDLLPILASSAQSTNGW